MIMGKDSDNDSNYEFTDNYHVHNDKTNYNDHEQIMVMKVRLIIDTIMMIMVMRLPIIIETIVMIIVW